MTPTMIIFTPTNTLLTSISITTTMLMIAASHTSSLTTMTDTTTTAIIATTTMVTKTVKDPTIGSDWVSQGTFYARNARDEIHLHSL